MPGATGDCKRRRPTRADRGPEARRLIIEADDQYVQALLCSDFDFASTDLGRGATILTETGPRWSRRRRRRDSIRRKPSHQ
jgi:hypothetical protein